MKANKALKRLAKIEALMSDVTERYSASGPHIRRVLQDAKEAITQAKEAVSLQASTGTAKNARVKDSKPPSKATPEPSKPKRKLSAAGRKAIIAATKKRWALKRAEAAKAQLRTAKKGANKKAARKKAATKKAATKKVATKKAATKKAATKKAATKKAATKKAAVKAPPAKTAKKRAPVKKSAAKKSAATKPAPAHTQTGTEAAARVLESPETEAAPLVPSPAILADDPRFE